MGANAPGGAAGGLFDMQAVANAEGGAPQTPISTQGLNRRNPPTAKPSGNAATGPSPAAGAQQRRTVKQVKKLADTDWLLVTTMADTQYYYNQKTKDSALRLPESVLEHIKRFNASLQTSPAASTSAQAKPSTTQSPSPTPVEPTSALHQASTRPLMSTSFTQNDLDTTPVVEEPDHFPPINSSKTPAKYYNRAIDSLRRDAGAQTDFEQKGDGEFAFEAPIERFDFTEEEKLERRAALQREYEADGNKDVLEISDEELDELMQSELSNYIEEEEDGLDIPEYYSKVTKRRKSSKQKDAPKRTSPLANLDATNLSLYENADRMIARGEVEKLIKLANASIARLADRVANGVPLNLREQSVYLNGLLMLARAQNKIRRWADASETLKRAVEVDPEHPSTHIIAALNKLPQNEFGVAMRSLNAALEVDPENVIALRLLCECYLDVGNLGVAEQVIDDALSVNKRGYESILLKAMITGMQGDMQVAGQLINRALKVDPKRPEAHIFEAKLYFGLGQTEKGMAAAQTALDIDQNYGPAYGFLGRVFLESDSMKDARNAYQAALEIDPYMVESLIGLATVESSEGHFKEALDLSSLATQVDNGALDAWMLKGRAELELKHWTAAVGSLERAISLEPEAEEAYLFLGTALHGAGRTKECIARMDQLLMRHPNSVKAYVNKGFAYQTTGQADKALELFEHAIAMDSTDEEAKMGKVTALFALGQRDEANAFYSTFKQSGNEEIFEHAKTMATKTQAAHQKRVQDAEAAAASPSDMPASAGFRESEFEDRADELSEEELDRELAKATETADIKYAPTAEELGTITAEQLAEALGGEDGSKPPADMSPDFLMKDLEGELSRVNEMLSGLGMPNLSMNPAENAAIDENFDPSGMSMQNMQEYFDLMDQYRQEVKDAAPDTPKTEDEIILAKSMGITPEALAEIKQLDNAVSPEARKNMASSLFKMKNKEILDQLGDGDFDAELGKLLNSKGVLGGKLKKEVDRIKSKKPKGNDSL